MPPSSSSSSSTSTGTIITQLLKKTSHYDKDERYMATSDLCELLKKISSSSSSSSTTIDTYLEKELCTTILRLLHDKSNDVQAIAIKTLNVMIITIIQNPITLYEIITTLFHQLISYSNTNLRDIYTAGLRNVIQTCYYNIGTIVLLSNSNTTTSSSTSGGASSSSTTITKGGTSSSSNNNNNNSDPPFLQRLLHQIEQQLQQLHNLLASSNNSNSSTTMDTENSNTNNNNSNNNSNSHMITECCIIITSCCDVIYDIIVRYGNKITTQYQELIIQVQLQLLLFSPTSTSTTTTTTTASTTIPAINTIRKRASTVLAIVSTICKNEYLLHTVLMEQLLLPLEDVFTKSSSNTTNGGGIVQQQQQQQSGPIKRVPIDTKCAYIIKTICNIVSAVGTTNSSTSNTNPNDTVVVMTAAGTTTTIDSSSNSMNNNNNNNNNKKQKVVSTGSGSGSNAIVQHHHHQSFQQSHIDRIIPIFLQFTNPIHAITGDDDDDEDNDDDPMDTNNTLNQQQPPIIFYSSESDHTNNNNNNMMNDTTTTTSASTTAMLNELREACFIGYTSFIVRCGYTAASSNGFGNNTTTNNSTSSSNVMEQHMKNIIIAAMAYMKYDPNYSYGIDNEADDDAAAADADNDEDNEGYENDDEEEDEYNEEEEDDDDDDDDDDDESWKVRRAAIRTLRSVIEMYGSYTSLASIIDTCWTTLYPSNNKGTMNKTISQVLMERFIEREENCRVDIIECYTKLVSTTIQQQELQQQQHQQKGKSNNDNTVDMDATTVSIVVEYIPKLVKLCTNILSKMKKSSGGSVSNATSMNDKSKSAAILLLGTLCHVPDHGLGAYNNISIVIQQIQLLLNDGNTGKGSTTNHNTVSKTLRLDTMSLLNTILLSEYHDPVYIRQCLTQSFVHQLCSIVLHEQWYKVIAETLRVLTHIPRYCIIGYNEMDNNTEQTKNERQQIAKELYTAIEPLLAMNDIDQEIKDGSLRSCAYLLQYLHIYLDQDHIHRLLHLLYINRLSNETTRITAMKAYIIIGQKPILPSNVATTSLLSYCPLQSILDDSITTMSSFLKLSNRNVKQNALETLEIIIQHHGMNVSIENASTLYTLVLQSLAPLISDRDLHISHLSLRVINAIVQVYPLAGDPVKDYVLDPALVLSTSTHLQDPTLESLLSFFKNLIIHNSIDFTELNSLLQAKLTMQTSMHGIYNLAKCIAVIAANATDETKQSFLQNILSLLNGSITPTDQLETSKVQLALLVTGNIGHTIDLSTMSDNVASRLIDIYIGYFDSSSEDVKNAAAYALGHAAIASQTGFLQSILTHLSNGVKSHTYLLLSALREFIVKRSRAGASDINNDDMSGLVSNIVSAVERYCSDDDEGVRMMVAECLGSLTCQQPNIMLSTLEKWQSSHFESDVTEEHSNMIKEDASICWTVATSIKLALAGKVNTSLLAVSMPTFVKLIQHKDVSVRHAALLMIYSAVHHMPTVIADLMKEQVMPFLYELAKLKLERKVDLGPFTHTVDDALPLRKAALSIFATCLENVPSCLDVSEFMLVLVKALGDAEDIQLHAHQIVLTMCHRQPAYIISAVDSFVEPLEKTMNKKAGEKTGTELDRLNDWIKSSLRVMVAISKLEGSMNSRKFADFYDRIKSNSKFMTPLTAIEEER